MQRRDSRRDLARQAEERIATSISARVVPLTQPAGVAAAVDHRLRVLASVVGRRLASWCLEDRRRNDAVDIAGCAFAVRVTPPAYTGAAGRDADRSRAGDGDRRQPRPHRIGIASADESGSPSESASLELRSTRDAPPRFLSVIVVPDTPPAVRINEPGRDTALATGTGTLTIALDGRDDLGLASLALRYTKVSGGGENVTFTEGAMPIAIERVSDREWRGRAQWPLDGLGLAEGDALVYRAVARDANPAGAPVQSDAFLIEIGRASEIAAPDSRCRPRNASTRSASRW